MALVPPAVLDEIRAKSDIVTVIGSYYHLNRAGGAWKMLCPFHKEKTPSFHINPQRQTFHCFGCGKGGDVFRFVMEEEKLDFLSAVRKLAQKANVRLVLDEAQEAGRVDREALFDLNAQVARFYHDGLLNHPEAEAARRYLKSRDLGHDVAADFLIGYAPDRWDALLTWAGGKFRREQLEAAGLVVAAPDRGKGAQAHYYDRFRNRVMFPIHDEQGRVAGFSGRTMEKDAPGAKYVNTPETVLFHKGRILYALHKARKPIVEAREAIVCEGQIDVIRCHLTGFPTAVASQGTAFTEDHARMLKRYADGVTLVFDADTAGQNAAVQAAGMFIEVGLAVRVASLPEGEDPDSLLRQEGGSETFRMMLQEAVSIPEYLVSMFRKRGQLKTDGDLLHASRDLVELIARAPNAVQQARLTQQAAAQLGIPEDALIRELRRRSRFRREPESTPGVAPAPPLTPAPPPCAPREMALTEHVATEPALAILVRRYLPAECLSDPLCRRLVEAAAAAADAGRDLMGVIAESDGEGHELSAFAAKVHAAPLKVRGAGLASGEDAVKSLILGLRSEHLARRRRTLEAQLADPALPLDEAGRRNLELNEIVYDLARLKSWETALPIMEGECH